MRLALATLSLSWLAVTTVGVAPAQTILFEETFDQGFTGWTSTGNWDFATDQDPCLPGIVPFPSPGGAARFGDADCTYNQVLWFDSVGPNGSLATDPGQPISIPLTAQNPALEFWYYADTESCTWGWDNQRVYVSEGNQPLVLVAEPCQKQQWTRHRVDLSPWIGKDIRLHFVFDAVDTRFNDGLGWVVDDVRILDDACMAASYCFAKRNSLGVGAIIGQTGSLEVTTNDLVLTADNVLPGEFGLFFYGPDPDQVWVNDGQLCVAAGGTGLARLLPATAADAFGHLELAVDLTSTLGTTTAILPGSTWRFQCWYRDSGSNFAGSNFTDALRVSFCP